MTQTMGPREAQNKVLLAQKLARAKERERQYRRDRPADLEALKQATAVASQKKGKARGKKHRRVKAAKR